ncbi:MAG: YheV family putative metal-binding protein [Pseudomonadales bacterium]
MTDKQPEAPAPGKKRQLVLVKRRFIAGAICPECRAEDRLQIEYWRTDEADTLREVRVCVACDFRDSADAVAAQQAKSLAALPRIRRGPRPETTPAQPLQLLDRSPAEQPEPSKNPSPSISPDAEP